jgi:hypothetical protein
VDRLKLHQLYRAMAWLGQPLKEQGGATPFAPRTTKDRIEEALFARRQDLFTTLDLVFFNTTSIYFEGEGGTRSGSMVSRRTTARIADRWWWDWRSMPTGARSAASCGRVTQPM